MAELYLIWPGPESDDLISLLTNYFSDFYPTLMDPFIVARNLESHIRELFADQDNITEVDNKLYYIGNIANFNLKLIMRSGGSNIFPYLFFETQGLIPPTDQAVVILFGIIDQTVATSLRLPIKSRIEQTWNQKQYELYVNKEIVLTKDFEKNQTGVFFYLIYLQQLFQNDSNVCVMISSLKPLIKRVKQLETDLGTLTEAEFKAKNPVYSQVYSKLISSYNNNKVGYFRFLLLANVITLSGPYLNAESNNGVNVQMNRSFRILFKRCQNSKARFTVSFITLRSEDAAHANILIIDNYEKVIERYDPNGSFPNKDYTSVTMALDEALDNFAKEMGYLYVSPEVFCPKLGVQAIENAFKNETGYCVSWSILYAEERLQTLQSRSYVSENLLRDIIIKYNLKRSNNQETAEAVESWIKQRIHQIFEDMDDLFIELANDLEIKLTYREGKLIYFP